MSRKSQTVLSLIGLSAFIGFLPSSGATLIFLKLICFGTLGFAFYYFFIAKKIQKEVKISIKDVRRSKKEEYRKKILNNIKSLGKVSRYEEDSRQVFVSVETKGSIEDVIEQVKKCDLKITLEKAIGYLEYTSLEAEAKMMVTVHGSATPGSEIIIDDIEDSISVDYSGDFAVEVPLSLIQKNQKKGYIPAVCKKGDIKDNIEIPLPR